MIDTLPVQQRNAGLGLIRLAWLLFLISLFLPAGKFVPFDLMSGIRGGSLPLVQYYGWWFLLLSSGAIFIPVALIIASPILLLKAMTDSMGAIGGILFLLLAVLLMLLTYKRKSLQLPHIATRIFRNTMLVILGLLLLVLSTNGKGLILYFNMIPGASTILILMTVVFFYSLFLSLGTYESRLYLCTSFFMLSTPGLIIVLSDREVFAFLVALPFIAMGTILLIRSKPFSGAKRMPEYPNWVLGNLALANLYIPLGLQQLSPALVTWVLCIACLAIGNNKRTNSLEPEEPVASSL